jgi:hypothetical protein
MVDYHAIIYHQDRTLYHPSTMPILTLNQAAKAAGKSKSALLAAMRSGRLSASKDEHGHYQIDPAELFRVYPPTGSLPGNQLDAGTATNPTHTAHSTTHEAAIWREKAELMERIIKATEAERDDLKAERERLLGVIEEQARTVRQLTHQPQPRQDSQAVRPWLWVLLAMVAIGAAVVKCVG